jgi:hypothetical protein
MPDPLHQMTEEPPMNKALEDMLALAGGDPGAESLILRSMMVLCCEYLSRLQGRGKCRDTLRDLDQFVRDAQPGRPWRD